MASCPSNLAMFFRIIKFFSHNLTILIHLLLWGSLPKSGTLPPKSRHVDLLYQILCMQQGVCADFNKEEKLPNF